MDLRDEAGAVLGAIYSSADVRREQRRQVLSRVQGRRALRLRSGRAHTRSAVQDTTEFKYDAQQHLLDLKFQDQAELKYDGSQHVLTVSLPNGAAFNLTANGAQIQIDSSGNVIIKSAGRSRSGTGCWRVSRALAIEFKSARKRERS